MPFSIILAVFVVSILIKALMPTPKPEPREATWVKWEAPIEDNSAKALRQYIETINFYGLTYGAKV